MQNTEFRLVKAGTRCSNNQSYRIRHDREGKQEGRHRIIITGNNDATHMEGGKPEVRAMGNLHCE